MKRRSFCAWMPMLPWPIWPLAGHARLGQNTVAGSMTILLSWLCWGACQEEVCLDPRFLCNLTPPRFSVELPVELLVDKTQTVEHHGFDRMAGGHNTHFRVLLGGPINDFRDAEFFKHARDQTQMI